MGFGRGKVCGSSRNPGWSRQGEYDEWDFAIWRQVRMWIRLEGRCYHNGRRWWAVKVMWRLSCVDWTSLDGQPSSIWSVLVEDAASCCGLRVRSSFSSLSRSRLKLDLLNRGAEIVRFWWCAVPIDLCATQMKISPVSLQKQSADGKLPMATTA